MTFRIEFFRIDDRARMARARRIREVVFCVEQGVPEEEEWDDKDSVCEHALVLHGEAAIGTARVRPYGPAIFKVERVAVLKEARGTGAGKAIMDAIIARLRANRASAVVLNAQTAVEDFYARLGFVSEGELFVEANIPHIHMVWRP